MCKNFRTSLINLPQEMTDNITSLIRDEKLGSYREVNANGLIHFLQIETSADLFIIFDVDVTEKNISQLNVNKSAPVVLITQSLSFEMERTAKASGIDFVLDLNNIDLITLIYGFIRQINIYRKYHALIVDDSIVDSKVNAHILKSDFVKNTIDNSSENVLSRLEKDQSINMVILDYEMPNQNGCLLMQSIQRHFPDRDVIFIGLTGSRNGAVKFLQAGAEDVFLKPIDSELFLIRLRKIIFENHQLKQERKNLADYKSLLRRVSHDIRNPVSMLMNLNDLFIEQSISKEGLEQAKEININTRNSIDNLFNEILGYIEVTSYKNNVALKACSLQAMIATQLYLESHQAKYKNIIINRFCDVEASIYCIPHQIESVISNLTNNAIKFSPQGGEVDVRLFKSDSEVVFEVEDSSPKIHEDEYETIFNAYSHASNAKPTGGEKSLGLGLVVCKEIIDTHAGEIGVKSGARGNIFYFRLPTENKAKES